MKNNFYEKTVKKIGEAYLKTINEEKKYKHILNETQFIKLKQIKDCLIKAGVKNIKVDLEPSEIHGGITASFRVLSLSKIELKPLFYALMNASAISIDSTTDGQVVLSCTIENLYRRTN